MKAGTYVKLTKLEGGQAPVSGEDRVNPNVGYTCKGVLEEDVKVGGTIWVRRVERNGIKALGYFHSSPIEAINGSEVKTRNSIWKIEEIQP